MKAQASLQLVPYGIGILTSIPAVAALRTPLAQAAHLLQPTTHQNLLQQATNLWAQRDSLEPLRSLLLKPSSATASASNSTAGATGTGTCATDMDCRLVYEALSAQNLVKLFLAFVVRKLRACTYSLLFCFYDRVILFCTSVGV